MQDSARNSIRSDNELTYDNKLHSLEDNQQNLVSDGIKQNAMETNTIELSPFLIRDSRDIEGQKKGKKIKIKQKNTKKNDSNTNINENNSKDRKKLRGIINGKGSS